MAASRRLIELEQQTADQRVRERIDVALRSGRLVDAQRAWAEQLILRDESLFDDWLRTAPVVVPMGATRPPLRSNGAAHSGGTEARARSEFRSNPLLGRLTSEEAYVASALRSAST